MYMHTLTSVENNNSDVGLSMSHKVIWKRPYLEKGLNYIYICIFKMCLIIKYSIVFILKLKLVYIYI